MRQAAKEHVLKVLEDSSADGSTRMFSIRHEFPSEWSEFLNSSKLTLNLKAEQYPYWCPAESAKWSEIFVYVKLKKGNENSRSNCAKISFRGKDGNLFSAAYISLNKDLALGYLLTGRGTLVDDVASPRTPVGLVGTLVINGLPENDVLDLWIAIPWTGVVAD